MKRNGAAEKPGLSIHPAPHQGTGRARTAAADRTHTLYRHGPAQKKLYIQTRENYRAELLGLIESEGMNSVRFKILEGLLRLRQIAIHPALVDKKYKGEAPKFEILLETLETLQAENHKALIFSQFVEALKLVKRELDARKIQYMYLDGKTQNRQAKVDEFRTNDAILSFSSA